MNKTAIDTGASTVSVTAIWMFETHAWKKGNWDWKCTLIKKQAGRWNSIISLHQSGNYVLHAVNFQKKNTQLIMWNQNSIKPHACGSTLHLETNHPSLTLSHRDQISSPTNWKVFPKICGTEIEIIAQRSKLCGFSILPSFFLFVFTLKTARRYNNFFGQQ